MELSFLIYMWVIMTISQDFKKFFLSFSVLMLMFCVRCVHAYCKLIVNLHISKSMVIFFIDGTYMVLKATKTSAWSITIFFKIQKSSAL